MKRIVILVVLTLISLPSHAEMYRWVNDDGQTVYSQFPPVSGTATIIKAPPLPAPRPTVQSEYEEESEAPSQTGLTEEQKQANCANAREVLSAYSDPNNRMIRMPDGSIEPVSDEKRKEQINIANQWVKQFCNSQSDDRY